MPSGRVNMNVRLSTCIGTRFADTDWNLLRELVGTSCMVSLRLPERLISES